MGTSGRVSEVGRGRVVSERGRAGGGGSDFLADPSVKIVVSDHK